MTVAINYANELFYNAQKLNTRTAKRKGKVDKVWEYYPDSIDKDFAEKHKDILSQKRGDGYWLWKPYIILDAIDKIKDGDYLIYTDSGTIYTDKVKHLTDCLRSTDILVFNVGTKECEYTKRDAFVIMNCDTPEYAESKQRLGGYIVLRKSEFSRMFVAEWLNYATDIRVISDDDNVMGKPNYEGFIDHRHDQSILSLLSKKYKIKAYRNPSQYGMRKKEVMSFEEKEILERSTYPQILYAHRNGKIKYVFQTDIKSWYKYVDPYRSRFFHNRITKFIKDRFNEGVK